MSDIEASLPLSDIVEPEFDVVDDPFDRIPRQRRARANETVEAMIERMGLD